MSSNSSSSDKPFLKISTDGLSQPPETSPSSVVSYDYKNVLLILKENASPGPGSTIWLHSISLAPLPQGSLSDFCREQCYPSCFFLSLLTKHPQFLQPFFTESVCPLPPECTWFSIPFLILTSLSPLNKLALSLGQFQLYSLKNDLKIFDFLKAINYLFVCISICITIKYNKSFLLSRNADETLNSLRQPVPSPIRQQH